MKSSQLVKLLSVFTIFIVLCFFNCRSAQSKLLKGINKYDENEITESFKYGASANVLNDFNGSCLDIFSLKALLDFSECSLRKISIIDEEKIPQDAKITALHYAILKKSSLTAILTLISNGADINALDSNGKTPLMYATELGLFDQTKLFVESKAKLNIQDYLGKTAIIYSANGTDNNHKKIYQLLLNKKANANLKDKLGNTAYDYKQARLQEEYRRTQENYYHSYESDNTYGGYGRSRRSRGSGGGRRRSRR